MRVSLIDTDILAPNFKKRLSGVTSTIVQLVPVQRKMGIRIAAVGRGLPDDLPHVNLRDLAGLWRKPASGKKFRIWHARRNVEMLAGIIMRDVLRMKLKVIFTSASQRHHKKFTKWLIRRMDGVLATSTRTASYLEVPNTVSMHGIDLEQFRPPQSEQDRFAATGLPGKYAIGCFGRVRHQKGTDLFVDAMIELLPRYPDWTAVVAGRATAEHVGFEKELQEKVRKAGLADRIIFLGEVPFVSADPAGDSISAWYRRLDVYVAPSRTEGFGLTPLEAMASQTAVVTSDAGAYPEIVVEGETGYVVPSGATMAPAIENYLRDPALAAQHAEKGLQRVREFFPLEREAKTIGDFYQRIFEQI
ncbi:glycosyltransferase family 4 protein [Ochrobactrum sp. SFR4]|uniref:glycosyltransferase family 4 protein n=1 Tax=Ochrobactrum sp. SFR4 TaxID=2717368 RepID=UPI001C8CA926|nr:glycosyltransferase family 4 protein [Ochrobactrum sp. SFR4]